MNFYKLVQAAMKVENFEVSSKERFQKRKLSRGGSSSSERARDNQAISMYGSVGRGRRQGPTTTLSFGTGMSLIQGENLECPYCHRWHSSVCRRVTRGWFRCGST